MSNTKKKEETFEGLGFVKDADGTYRFSTLEIPPAPTPELSTDGPVKRLVITHLTVTNFKSYAGKQIIGPFDKNFTAVVGPNGSGKSNVIDALMFVFGKKSKDIRAKKAKLLIHKSEKYQDVKSCSVAVSLVTILDEGEKGATVVDGTDIIICRGVDENGGSHYELNQKRVQYKEISLALRGFGIDMEYCRFLILQGEIESISLMQPKATPKESIGMLEYIEDIVGSQRLIEPIKFFANKMQELAAQESEKGKEVDLFEKEKKELEGPKNNAIAYLRLENKRVLCENSILLSQRKKAGKELEDITEAKNKFLEEVKSLKAEIAKVQESKKALESDLAEVAAKHDSILKKRDEYDEEFKVLIQKDAANLEDIKHIKGKIQSAKKGLEDSQSEIKKLTKQLTIYEKETDELQVKKKKLEEEKTVEEKKATQVMGTAKEETEKMQERKDVKEAELIKLKENMYQIKSEMDLIKSELSICVSGEKREKEKLSALQSNYKTNNDSAKQEEVLVQEEASQVKEIEKELSSLKEQLSQAKEKELSLFQQNRDARQKWEEARSSQQSNRNNTSLLQAIFKAKAAGKLPAGIYGRLGNLGAIDEKYDIAISTICGVLDHIVVDTFETGQQCVNYLKKHNLGYTTFVNLKRMTEMYGHLVHRKVQTPENIPRLFDLIRVNDQSYLPAFYHAVRETLVANDLEQASRIGHNDHHGRHKVVALNGTLVEPSGAMVGGGTRVIRGKIGQKVVENAYSEQELADMAAQVNTLSKELMEVKQLCISLDDKIAQMTDKLSSLHHSLKKRSLRCSAFKEQIKMITSQIKEQEKKMQASTVDEKKVSELEEKIKTKNKIYTKSVQETSVVENEVTELQAKILEVTKGKYSKAKKTVDQLKKKLDEVTQAITKSTVNMKQSKTKVKKLENKLETLQADLIANEKEMLMLKDKQSDLTDKGQKTNAMVQQHNEELVEYVEKQKSLKKEVGTINEKEHELKRVEIEHKNKMKTFEANEVEKRAYIKGFNSKLGKLKLKEVENDPTEIPALSDEDVSKLNMQDLHKELGIITVELEDMKPDLSSIDEFKRREQMFLSKLKEHNDLRAEKCLQESRKKILYKLRTTEFMLAFATITAKVKEIYQMLTSGGDAELELVNRRDPFEGGIAYSVRPPKKAWKSMSHLSGGEKTLSSLALVFALHYYRTTPFYVMDEIDAALDETNVGIVGKYLQEHQKNAQFIIVSLRNVMNELPDHLLGVHKINNCTRNIHLDHCIDWKGTKRPKRREEPSG